MHRSRIATNSRLKKEKVRGKIKLSKIANCKKDF